MSNSDEKNIELLLRQLEDSDNIDVRSNAASKLGYITSHQDEIVKALTEALSDENWLVRVEAAKALGRIGKAACKAIEVLKNVMVEPRNRAKRGIFYEILQTLEKVQSESPKTSVSTELVKEEELSLEMEEIMEEVLDEAVEDSFVEEEEIVELQEEKSTDLPYQTISEDEEVTPAIISEEKDEESVEDILDAVEEALEDSVELPSEEEIVEDVLEETVEDALEEAIEDIVDDSVAEDIIEDIAEDIAEEVIEFEDKPMEDVETIIDEPEEEVIEDALEDAVEDALEEAIEDVVDDSVAEEVIEDIAEEIADEVIEDISEESETEVNIPLDQVLVFDDEDEEIKKKMT
ncbi:MAG TPA: HEAT repeat domain-containing protein [Candidatus Bathyarchaeia archaeon]|nr:HEAT repeat domain-containing protein [Candidatus Bathyarchaeia archaeon]